MSRQVTPRFKRIAMRRKRTDRARSHRQRMDDLRPVVFARAFYRCEIAAPGCTGHVEEAHHAVLRSQGGPDTLDNLIAACLFCHRYVHANPAWSRERGFIRSRPAA